MIDVVLKDETHLRVEDGAVLGHCCENRPWLVLLLDDKTFAEDQVVIALGVADASACMKHCVAVSIRQV